MCGQVPTSEGDRGSDQAINQIVVGGQNDGRDHRHWTEHAEYPQGLSVGRPADRNAYEQIPADVQAGECGVFVDECGRLQHPV